MLNDLEQKELLKKICKRLEENTSLPVIKLSISKDGAGILDSKVGGAFYVPSGDSAPKCKKTGKNLLLLAQVNFGDLPKLEGYPEKGLLQFFIDGNDDVFGLNFDDQKDQDGWRVKYIPDLPDISEIAAENICEPKWSENTFMPFDEGCVYRLTGEKVMQMVTYSDFRYEQLFEKHCSDLLSGNEDDEFMDKLYDMLPLPFKCQIGGYPTFTQWDIRENDGGDEPDLLLFQLDSTYDKEIQIEWGDAGVCNFFISKADLENKDFSKVTYNWDCC